MCCVARVIAHLKGRGWNGDCQAEAKKLGEGPPLVVSLRLQRLCHEFAQSQRREANVQLSIYRIKSVCLELYRFYVNISIVEALHVLYLFSG